MPAFPLLLNMQRRRPITECSGFSLAEVLVAIGLCLIAFTCFFAATGQALRVAQSAKQEVLASQVLQHRFETFHATRDWNKMLDPSGVSTLLTNAPEASASLNAPVESYVLSAHPAGTPSITISRNAQGTVTSVGTKMPATVKAVKVVGQLSWAGVGNTARSRDQATLLTKGGI